MTPLLAALLIALVLAIAWALVNFIAYKREADAEDRYADEQDALDDVCEHRAAPELDKSGILRCPTCGRDMEA